jgi:transposase-like protein
MTCEACDVRCQRFGVHRNGLRRFRCPQCHKTYTEPHRLTLGEMYISEEKALLAMQLIVEGNSIRSTMRITGLDQNTIMKAPRAGWGALREGHGAADSQRPGEGCTGR